MRITSTLVLIASAAILGACSIQHEEQIPLRTMLAGKSQPERKEILLKECKSEAKHLAVHEYTNRHYIDNKSDEFRLMDICNAMSAELDKDPTQ